MASPERMGAALHVLAVAVRGYMEGEAAVRARAACSKTVESDHSPDTDAQIDPAQRRGRLLTQIDHELYTADAVEDDLKLAEVGGPLVPGEDLDNDPRLPSSVVALAAARRV